MTRFRNEREALDSISKKLFRLNSAIIHKWTQKVKRPKSEKNSVDRSEVETDGAKAKRIEVGRDGEAFRSVVGVRY